MNIPRLVIDLLFPDDYTSIQKPPSSIAITGGFKEWKSYVFKGTVMDRL